MPDHGLQRFNWDGHPVQRGVAFELSKQKGERELRAVCTLQTHVFGFELVLTLQGRMSRTQVCRSSSEVLATIEQWRTGMRSAGWRDPERTDE